MGGSSFRCDFFSFVISRSDGKEDTVVVIILAQFVERLLILYNMNCVREKWNCTLNKLLYYLEI